MQSKQAVEKIIWQHNPETTIIGIDEVGKGCLAGPVYAAACALHASTSLPPATTDSKKLSAKQRLALYPHLLDNVHISVGHASVEEIDSLGIQPATFLAMHRAFRRLTSNINHTVDDLEILIDGNRMPSWAETYQSQVVIKGDMLCQSISAASIVAKVTRDTEMVHLSKNYPLYAWHNNMGYGTKEHRLAIARYGKTIHHRQLFTKTAMNNLGLCLIN